MGKSLMRLPIFNESIQKSHNILKQFGIDLIKIISNNDSNTFNNTVNCFVGIAAMQVNILLFYTPNVFIKKCFYIFLKM